jgi:5-methylcytosine-specific restriction protein B
MAKHDLEHLAGTYAAAERFVEHALRRDDSLFTPGRPIWSLSNFVELDRLYVQAPDPGAGTFEQKLRLQNGTFRSLRSA